MQGGEGEGAERYSGNFNLRKTSHREMTSKPVVTSPNTSMAVQPLETGAPRTAGGTAFTSVVLVRERLGQPRLVDAHHGVLLEEEAEHGQERTGHPHQRRHVRGRHL